MNKKIKRIIQSLCITIVFCLIAVAVVVPTRNIKSYSEPVDSTIDVVDANNSRCSSDKDNTYLIDVSGLKYLSLSVEYDNTFDTNSSKISEKDINGMVIFFSGQNNFTSTCLNWSDLKHGNKIYFSNDNFTNINIEKIKVKNLENVHFKKITFYSENFQETTTPLKLDIVLLVIGITIALAFSFIVIFLECKFEFLEKLWALLKRNFKLFCYALLAILASCFFGLIFERIVDCFLLTKASTAGIFNIYLLLFFASFIFMCVCFIYNYKNNCLTPERAFVLIALNLGILLIFISPSINSCWDTDTHFMNIIGMASPFGQASLSDMNVSTSNMKTLGIASLSSCTDTMNFFNNNNDSIVYFANRDFSIDYLPGALAAAISQFLGCSFYVKYGAIRLTNLICYILITYFAIKKLKSGKIILLVIALFPTNIFTATSCSYDWWVNAFSFLGMAYFIGEMQDSEKPITFKNTLIMGAALFLAFIPKQIYILFMILPLFMPKNKFASSSDRKKYILVIISFIFLMFLFLMIRSLTAISSSGDSRGGAGVSPADQVIYILTNPLQYTKTLLAFLYEYLSVANSNLYTCNFANFGVGVFSVFYVVLIIAATITDKNQYDKNTAKTYLRIICIAFFLITTVLIATSLYVDFTAVGAKTISGVQGRYLIPMLFPLLTIIGSSKIINKISAKQYSYAFYGVCTIYLYLNFGQVFLMKLMFP